MAEKIRFASFPRTEAAPDFISSVVGVFQSHLSTIGTVELKKGLTSDQVLSVLCGDLMALGFDVETGKKANQKIRRPVFFGENGRPDLRYEIDAYHPEWSCGLEVEAGRAWMGNAVYRDLIQALVMVQLDHLVLAVPQTYKYLTSKRPTSSRDYDENTVAVADALYGHSRIQMPFTLTVVELLRRVFLGPSRAALGRPHSPWSSSHSRDNAWAFDMSAEVIHSLTMSR